MTAIASQVSDTRPFMVLIPGVCNLDNSQLIYILLNYTYMSPEWNDRFIYFSAIGTFISFIGIGRLFVKDKSKQIQINELKNIAASSSQIEPLAE